MGGKICFSLGGVVLCALRGAAERGVASGDEADEEAGIDGEGGRALACVEHSEASAGSGTDVEEASAPGEADADSVDRHCDGGQYGADRSRDAGILIVDDGEHGEGRKLINLLAVRVPGFGGQGSEPFGGPVCGVVGIWHGVRPSKYHLPLCLAWCVVGAELAGAIPWLPIIAGFVQLPFFVFHHG